MSHQNEAMNRENQVSYLTLHEYVKKARQKLTPDIWDYLIGGTETETTLRRNRLGIETLALRPRVLRDVSALDASTSFAGRRIRLPVALAPVGSLESMSPGGTGTAALAAEAFGVPIIASSVTPAPILAEVAKTKGPKVFQLYVRGDEAWQEEQIKRAEDAGYDMFCFTVDTAIYSRRERDIAKRFVKSWRAAAVGMQYQAALNWKHVEHYKAHHKLPLVLKGIGTSEDASMAVEHGVDVLYVSNHGGRQLDHGRGSIEVLPEVVQAAAGRAKVWVDGGFSRGTDVIKAIALGADLVGLGRLYCYGLAAEGQAGVEGVLSLLENEMHSALGLLGAPNLAALGPQSLHSAGATTMPHVHSAFPLLNLADQGY
ncbi:alpha-hydroxy acid oxidase [Plastoroseomonas arctica]|uniref:Alpha-hydroxy-acid oxidizing protein n=1 Tax=Plastoroseomonas arctica TaxID=1509237 RepID=A0AAF1KK75_9PROT|nr:alpha-hydroxy acid oxidase [Plastoroseomonas arctica]MBR0656295.1 alpha-hydroxy-acid oxidizing protein [Plastoroseomonas arctica]